MFSSKCATQSSKPCLESSENLSRGALRLSFWDLPIEFKMSHIFIWSDQKYVLLRRNCYFCIFISLPWWQRVSELVVQIIHIHHSHHQRPDTSLFDLFQRFLLPSCNLILIMVVFLFFPRSYISEIHWLLRFLDLKYKFLFKWSIATEFILYFYITILE